MVRRIVFLCAALVCLGAAPASAELKFSLSCGPVPCAKLDVPLDRSGKVPGTIELSIERARVNGKQHEGAVFALAGGPGQAGSIVTDGFKMDTFGAIGTRDLIVVDQRGTGRSGALDCKALEAPTDDRPIDERTAQCAQELGDRRGFYTTADTVEDLEAVRAELGIERISLLGVSYGTKVAETYAATYPEHVEKLVLDSVVPPEGQSPFDLDSYGALDRVLGEICRGECGYDLAADVATLADRMAEAPLRGPVIDPRGKPVMREVTARDLYQRIRAGDVIPEFRTGYPGAVHAAVAGDLAPLLRLEHGFSVGRPSPKPISFAQELSFTLQAATLCEEAPLPWERFATPAERDAQAQAAADAIDDNAFEPFSRAVALFGDSNNLLLQCRQWPTTPQRTPPPTLDDLPDVPTLVLEGLEDTRTPLELGQRVAAAIGPSELLAVPKTGHSVLSGTPCARAALKRFFAGDAIGAPCGKVKRSVRVAPTPPASLADVPGATKRARKAAATRLTVKDAFAQTTLGYSRGGGLRAGSYKRRGKLVVLDGFSYVRGLKLSGAYAANGKPAGRP